MTTADLHPTMQRHAMELQALLNRLEDDHPARARVEARLLEAKGGPPATETLKKVYKR